MAQRIFLESDKRPSYGSLAVAAVVTVLWVIAVGVSVSGYHRAAVHGRHTAADSVRKEALIFVRTAEAPPPPPPPLRPPPNAPRAVQRAPVSATPVAPPPVEAPRAADSSSRAAAPTTSVPGNATTPTIVAPAGPARAGSGCIGPCDAGTTIGIHNGGGRTTSEERDSVLQAMRAKMGASPPSGRPTSGMGGVSIAVGLPGGGPSRAQRKRDSTVNADVVSRLERIRARADSIAKERAKP